MNLEIEGEWCGGKEIVKRNLVPIRKQLKVLVADAVTEGAQLANVQITLSRINNQDRRLRGVSEMMSRMLSNPYIFKFFSFGHCRGCNPDDDRRLQSIGDGDEVPKFAVIRRRLKRFIERECVDIVSNFRQNIEEQYCPTEITEGSLDCTFAIGFYNEDPQ